MSTLSTHHSDRSSSVEVHRLISATRSALRTRSDLRSSTFALQMKADPHALAVGVIEVLAPRADVQRLNVDSDTDVVTVWTRRPGLLIGRRGATADSIRAALCDALCSHSTRLNIVEVAGDAPDDPSSGVREPRRPKPTAPSTRVELR